MRFTPIQTNDDYISKVAYVSIRRQIASCSGRANDFFSLKGKMIINYFRKSSTRRNWANLTRSCAISRRSRPKRWRRCRTRRRTYSDACASPRTRSIARLVDSCRSFVFIPGIKLEFCKTEYSAPEQMYVSIMKYIYLLTSSCDTEIAVFKIRLKRSYSFRINKFKII